MELLEKRSRFRWERDDRSYVWIESTLSARIKSRGVTEDGMLRHPSFKGLVSEE